MSTDNTTAEQKRILVGSALTKTRADALRIAADHLFALGPILEDLGGYAGHLREGRDNFLTGSALRGLKDYEDAAEVLEGIQGAIAARITEIKSVHDAARERGIL